MSARAPEIRALTGLRGAAACWVMVYHTAYRAPTGTAIGRLIHHGYLAVDLFFILSGYVLALNYGEWFGGAGGGGRYVAFLHKRFARIYPLYVVVTAIAVAAMATRHRVPVAGIAANLLLVQSWHTGFTSIDGPSWSISCELSAYLLFPWFCRALLFGGRAACGIGLGLAALVIAGLAIVPDSWVGETGFRSGPLDIWIGSGFGPVLRCLAEFAVGVALFRASRHPLGESLRSAGFLWVGIAGVALGLLCLPGTDVAVVALFAALVFGLSADTGPLASLVGSAPVFFLGVISYSIYLVHDPMLSGLQLLFSRAALVPHGLARAVLAWAAILGVSTATYATIERPARGWINRLGGPFLPAAALPLDGTGAGR